MSASTVRSWARMRCRSPSSSATRRNRPRRHQATAPSVSASTANTARQTRPLIRLPPQPGSAVRTAAVNSASPAAASFPGCPPHRDATTCTAASQVSESNGPAHASGATGQATDKKSRTRCTDAVAAVISCARRRPRCRRCAHVSSSSSGI